MRLWFSFDVLGPFLWIGPQDKNLKERSAGGVLVP